MRGIKFKRVWKLKTEKMKKGAAYRERLLYKLLILLDIRMEFMNKNLEKKSKL